MTQAATEVHERTPVPLRIPPLASRTELSAVFGVATLPLLWAAGRRLGGRPWALAATVLYAYSPFTVRYSTEARPYALVAFLVVAGWLALRRAEEVPTGSRLLLVSLMAGLLLLSHYWCLFLLGRRPGRVIVAESGPQFEHGWLERYPAP